MMPVRKNENWLPSIFQDFFDNDWTMRSIATLSPAINVVEDDKSYKIELATPGLSKDDFKLSIDKNNNLVISMDKKEENKTEEKGKYIHKEFSYTKFQQTMLLPDNVKSQDISAKVENGILEITVPKIQKSEEVNTERLIEIH